jgi:hypothetical protein
LILIVISNIACIVACILQPKRNGFFQQSTHSFSLDIVGTCPRQHMQKNRSGIQLRTNDDADDNPRHSYDGLHHRKPIVNLASVVFTFFV